MYRHLYFICPTDSLELTINRSFENNNYYYTSLGNSVVLDKDTASHIKQLILKHDIQEIVFVLSNNNPVVRDALENQYFNSIRGLNHFYNTIARRKDYSDIIWQKNSCPFTILSHYLNEKIKELQIQLKSLNLGQVRVSGKIYDQNKHTFDDIYSNLICRDFFSLN